MVVFRWPPGQHAVVQLPDEAAFDACERPQFRLRAGPTDTPFRYAVPRPGETAYFACPIDSHCEQGQKVKIVSSGSP